ncbi:487af21d-5352-42b8-bc8c-7c71cb6f7010 [Thermothielavioides terrestris]|nr:487af21d-5352-42b8-bc8c-7c71cb6f7010 [Thermothielavioides terrestris]
MLNGLDAAQVWSLCRLGELFWNYPEPNHIVHPSLAGELKEARSVVKMDWSLRGFVSKEPYIDPDFELGPRYRYLDEESDGSLSSKPWLLETERISQPFDNRASLNATDVIHGCPNVDAIKAAARRSEGRRYFLRYNTGRNPPPLREYPHVPDEILFNDSTLFYDNISTEQGRQQLSRYPLSRALCNALQLAGYRADMDADGDIWFEDDDGDRYYDAREYQPGPDQDDDVVENCPVCQNPDKYGLGFIIRRAKMGEAFVDEFRARRKEGKYATL